MSIQFPYKFTLENGTQVLVKKADDDRFDFTLIPNEGEECYFSYNRNDVMDDEAEEKLSFDQLNALRRFWLELE